MNKDWKRLRNLAEQWMNLAQMPVMQERKKLWGNLHGLKQTRPMILIETMYIQDFVKEEELCCEDPYLRNVERYMQQNIIHAKELGDDIVLEPFFRIGWSMQQPSFGVEIKMIDSPQKGLAYVFEHVIKRPEDMEQLVKRRFTVDKPKTMQRKQLLQDIFGDILPVRVCNYDFMDEDGIYEWVGNFFFGLTWQLHRFIGLQEMMYWYYDYPDEMHAFLQYMVDDRLAMFCELEQQGCLASNSDNQMAGPRFYGYCDDMPYFEGEAKLNQLWAWCESQESSSISVAMFEEFVLPYLAQLAKQFGKLYYGCCEPVYDRLDVLKKALPNMRAVSVSMWNDFHVIGDLLGKDYVYSRKPSPPPISGKTVDWDELKKDLVITKKSAKNCHLELLFRDVYDIDGDRSRLTKWVKMAKVELGI